MSNAKMVSTPLATQFKLSYKQCPSTDKEKENMARISYMSTVGSLMYVMICTRSDITHVIGVISRFLSYLGKEHWNVIKWIIRYMCVTSNMRLSFGSGESMLVGYIESDMVDPVDTHKSTIGLFDHICKLCYFLAI